MRRLPVYFLIDVSDSMIGEPISAINEGLNQCMEVLQSDPYALETAYINVITFAGKVVKIVNMKEVYLCHIPEISVGSGTSYGKALTFLMDDIDANVRKNTPESKGDWRPIIFFFTDGAPTDKYQRALSRWTKNYMRKCTTVAISIGASSDINILKHLSNEVIQISEVNTSTIKQFFKWVSSSVQNSSVSIGRDQSSSEDLIPSNININGVRKIDATDIQNEQPSENCVILHGQCEETHGHYLIKYTRSTQNDDIFHISGAYSINIDEYNKLSANNSERFIIDSDFLEGFCPCPCCGNDFSLVLCGSCKHIHCASSKPKAICTCPHCGNKGILSNAVSLSLNRTLG